MTSTSDEELDAAILTVLRESGGDLVAWAALRAKLPAATPQRKATALVRLYTAGAIDAVKVDGCTFVTLPLVIP